MEVVQLWMEWSDGSEMGERGKGMGGGLYKDYLRRMLRNHFACLRY